MTPLLKVDESDHAKTVSLIFGRLSPLEPNVSHVVLLLGEEDDSRRNEGDESSLAQPYRFSPTDVGFFIAKS